MLVLSRQRDETIMLDFSRMTDDELKALREEPIELTTVDIRGDKVRHGITAPKPVGVHRKEVYDEIQRDPKRAEYDLHRRRLEATGGRGRHV